MSDEAGSRSRSRSRRLLVAVATGLLLTAGCGGDPSDRGGTGGEVDEVVLVSHDSFVFPDDLVDAFEAETGLRLRLLMGGDAVEALNQAILTAENPQGDVFFGVDELTLSRALDSELFQPYRSSAATRVIPELLVDEESRVTPIDHGAACVNYDAEWFTAAGLAPPEDLASLADEAYRGLLVVENPASSSPGLSFLAATVAEFGEQGWEEYWSALRANEVLVTSGWSEAYFGSFSGGSGEGDRPLVVSYGSSPPAEVLGVEPLPDEAPTGVIESTCVRQIEFAGILSGARNPEGAGKLIDFLLSDSFQAEVPMNMFVYPAVADVALPEVFERFAVVPQSPYTVDVEQVASQRDGWIERWTTLVLR